MVIAEIANHLGHVPASAADHFVLLPDLWTKQLAVDYLYLDQGQRLKVVEKLVNQQAHAVPAGMNWPCR